MESRPARLTHLIQKIAMFIHECVCKCTVTRTLGMRLADAMIVGQDVRGYMNAVIRKLLMMSGPW